VDRQDKYSYGFVIILDTSRSFYCVCVGILSGKGTVASIVSCRCTYCCPETCREKITKHYSQYCAVAFCYVHKCEPSYLCVGHDIELHVCIQSPDRVKLYRMGSGLVLAKALT